MIFTKVSSIKNKLDNENDKRNVIKNFLMNHRST